MKLTDTQLVLLSAAGQRDDHRVPADLKLRGGPLIEQAAKLAWHGLLEELAVERGGQILRTDENGQGYGFRLTEAGLQAVGLGTPETAGAPSTDAQSVPHGGEPSSPNGDGNEIGRATSARRSRQTPRDPNAVVDGRSGRKRAEVISLLQRPTGASTNELTAATGWLPHSLRAALSGLRRQGYAIAREKGEGDRGTVYHLSLPVAEAAEPATVEV